MKRGKELYSGKAKSMHLTEDPGLLIMEFRDDTSAFDGEKIEQLDRKGMVNNLFNAFIMTNLENAGVDTHFDKLLSETESIVTNLDMIPVECVVRNIATGSLCKRLGIEDGLNLKPPTFEFFLKDDARHDPMINDYHIDSFGWATRDEVALMKRNTFQVNDILGRMFADAGMILVDFKVEFGRCDGNLVLGDEFTPDGCRVWDAETRKKLDKDRFRHGLGSVIEAYEEVALRLGVNLDVAAIQ
ncbi:MAG TPA: phosphoribosylaminoimidazolesuccinocarboxamide synthase [Arenicellales bacterium]|jgi:phosphoribosylaminoimidazole-succinocarboxamide synthase|uniref:Phosphoribosylaminoimidazole-succinocarboxamide synthase n=1 Tax=marine metagenome TaxID=408172 RepID=A0A382B233_9ZZZZ|nr:phosphoribosylaminoimidazolesuccinocarboxamide synthase [Arenicellales bacterium]MEC7790883.1 phosphoribosylaminoimidazolesuccinocarboxamide synthase [Pseudomonadota bacterium]MEC8870435.1 phosphoribosylaminoimidazolesuccinocarboxamide synthase [Pseudomonadota bacterium]HJM01539.1 phosphoribosylaminoimidazolesuccinocarboxamide synthase [Arenicellales bacterium]|tara:strand:- start:894 stop:1622 length:729 start_codon:yes stop_codon:yes gene_type:complete